MKITTQLKKKSSIPPFIKEWFKAVTIIRKVSTHHLQSKVLKLKISYTL